MKIKMTVGLKEYDGIGTSEADFMFNDFSDIKVTDNSLTLEVWGVDFSTDFLGNKITEYLKDSTFKFVSDEIHVNGKTTFTFHNVVRVSTFRDIILETDIGNKQSVPYVIGGVLPKRDIFDEITIDADEFFTISFDTDDFISIEEYCKNPKEYTYKR